MVEEKPVLEVPKANSRAALAKNMGLRLRASRESIGMAQGEAARRLGYANQTKLAKIEGGTDTNSVPHWVVLRAARLYDVSIDYIYGESDDWELSARALQERDMAKWMMEAWEAGRQRDLEVLRKLKLRMDAISETVTGLFSASQDVQDALRRFVELNSETFDEMRGGNRLLVAVDKLFNLTGTCQRKVTRFSRQCEVSGIGAVIVSQIDKPVQKRLL